MDLINRIAASRTENSRSNSSSKETPVSFGGSIVEEKPVVDPIKRIFSMARLNMNSASNSPKAHSDSPSNITTSLDDSCSDHSKFQTENTVESNDVKLSNSVISTKWSDALNDALQNLSSVLNGSFPFRSSEAPVKGDEDSLDTDDADLTPEEKIKKEQEDKIRREEQEARNKQVVEERMKSFEHLTENLYLVERKRSKQNKEVRRMVCDCSLTKEELEQGEKGCGDDCLNRLLMIECGWRCSLAENCLNRQFQKCDYAPTEVFNADEKGCGVRATQHIAAGTFIMEYIGEVFDEREFRRRRKDYGKDGTAHFYFMSLKADQYIDATKKGNSARFVNHSCDPNAETQKWTVDGELRVGFFATKTIRAGEEINFDYRMERYGREPQKCYCGTAACRGWLGEAPDELTKEEKKRKDDKSKKKEDKKPVDNELQDDLSELQRCGLRNRAYTLLLCRVMVRAELDATRKQLLELIISAHGNTPCLRLLLDYHGLGLLWSWMADVGGGLSSAPLRLLILQTLDILPISTRTQVEDSRVLQVVERWSKLAPPAPAAQGDSGIEESPSPEQEAAQPPPAEAGAALAPEQPDAAAKEAEAPPKDSSPGEDSLSSPVDAPKGCEELSGSWQQMAALAGTLAARWRGLAEEFRIPRRQRVRLMREHERLADDGYRAYLGTERGRRELLDTRAGRGRIFSGWRRQLQLDQSSWQRQEPDPAALAGLSRAQWAALSKEERRQCFAKQAAEQDARRALQDELWALHLQRCGRLGLDPQRSAVVDPQGRYYWHVAQAAWVPLPPEAQALLDTPIQQTPLEEELPPISPHDLPIVNGEIARPEVVSCALPPHWRVARDRHLRLYFYHSRSRQVAWDVPGPHTPVDLPAISDSSSESSSSSSCSEDEALEGKILRHQRGRRRHSEALVQQRVISPIRELDRDALRAERQAAKERAKQEARRERQGDETKPPKAKCKQRAATAIADTSERARKLKDAFRARVAGCIVAVLNPYRRPDCRQGRITSNDDFKYLARKLTHFVLVKELKQLGSVEALDCSDSVKHKTRDFVRKYLAKYGAAFRRDPSDTREY